MSTEVKTDEKKVGDTKPDPKKPIDRKRPFLRVNNEQFVPSEKPDGFGKACGCRTPDEFEGFQAEFLKFLDSDVPALKTLFDILDAVKTAARAASTALAVAQFIIPPLAFLKIIADVTEVIVTVIDTFLRKFLARLAELIFRRAIRTLPQWVPVKKDSPKARITADQIHEVEGVITRSFGNPIDVPFVQWHRWFNWNVQIKVDDKYKTVRSPADDPPNKDGFAGARPLFKADCFEIQMDTGALWDPNGGGDQAADKLKNGLIKESSDPTIKTVVKGAIEDVDWPPQFTDFCWPSTDMAVWAAGRWVYDCSRTTSIKKDEKDKQPQMVAMLNPCKAIATARFKALKFTQNDLSVPAIQFMFFTCKRGGYLDFETISDQDYEFILDLPPNDFKPAAYPIGATPKFPHNTIVVRPRLLHTIDKSPFEIFMGAIGAKKADKDKSPDPIITLIPAEKPGELPKQVKIKIPCTKLGNAEAYGFILSFGWHDPLQEQARKVKECTINVSQFTGAIQNRDNPLTKIRTIFGKELDELEDAIAAEAAKQVAKITILGVPVFQVPGIGPFIQNTLIKGVIKKALQEFFELLEKRVLSGLETEEWLLRVGVNGRWERVYIHKVPRATTNPNPQARLFIPKPLPHPIRFEDFRLEEDEPFRISAHGMEWDPVGDMMWSSHANRTLKLDGKAVDWSKICDPADKTELRRLAMNYTLALLTDSTSTLMALGLENSPLGIIDPDPGKSGPFPISNPVELKTAEAGFPDGLQKALFAKAVNVAPDDANPCQDQLILAEDTSKDDYEIFYTLDIKNQVAEKK